MICEGEKLLEKHIARPLSPEPQTPDVERCHVLSAHRPDVIASLCAQYTTVQISPSLKKKKNLINQEFSRREFKFNLPKEAASCTLLKHVRVQGFKGLWHRLTASGQGQLLSALVLGVGQGLTCK